ncbi:MAG: hypothetical protein Edafosvirus7_32 [Edafosvirus sp.]|uniref:Uncharacterized protein n=1 Tax=Edafosvirus sp. TaxID=2487765 RepID=A0A3G4ZTL7_9VIRU|nr:MAG: hypothetical protein Edafosvirus7_32 [Edafosvirus sp.]
MSNKINNQITNYKTHNIDNMYYDDIQSYGVTYYKMNFYNSEIKFPLQKYWVFIPKVKIISSYMQSIKIVLSCELEDAQTDMNDLEKFIISLQKKIKNIVRNKLDKKVKMKSCLQFYDHFPTTMSIKINSKTSIFNEQSKPIPSSTLKPDQLVSLYIELSEIWIDETKFGFNWNILQMKVHADIDFSICLIDNNETINENVGSNIKVNTQDENSEVTNTNIPPPPPLTPYMSYANKQKLIVKVEKKVAPKEEQQKFVPSLSDLLIQLKNLKKVIKPEDKTEIPVIVEDKTEIPVEDKIEIPVEDKNNDNKKEKHQFNKQLDDFFGHVIRKRERDLRKHYKNDEELQNNYEAINKSSSF